MEFVEILNIQIMEFISLQMLDVYLFLEKDGNSHPVFMINAEFTETATTTAQTLVPVAQLMCCDVNRVYNGYENISYRGEGGAIWQDQITTYPWISFLNLTFLIIRDGMEKFEQQAGTLVM